MFIQLNYLTFGILAFTVTLVIIHMLKQPAAWLGLADRPSSRKRHQGEVPVTGGIAMISAFSIIAILAYDLDFHHYGLLSGMLLLAIVGMLDDLWELNATSRLAAQVAAALCMVSGGVYLRDLGELFGSGLFTLPVVGIPITVFCVVGVINSINMVDGLDGLAGGTALLAIGWLVLISPTNWHPETGLLVMLSGVIVGFLCFNLRHPWRHRATVFMGDAGSTTLGFALAWFLVRVSQGDGRAMSPVIALWLLALPLMDTANVILRRLRAGQHPFAADRRHLHHLLLRYGYSDAQSTALLLLGSALLGGVGIGAWTLGVPDYLINVAFWGMLIGYFWLINLAWRYPPQATRRLLPPPATLTTKTSMPQP